MINAREALVRAGQFEVTGAEPMLRLSRRRSAPSRGVLRLLIPRVVARVDMSSPIPHVSVLPDTLAWFMVVMFAGGVIVEVTMDRVRYPREYPPAFIFGLAAFYVVALGVEWRRTRAAILQALR